MIPKTQLTLILAAILGASVFPASSGAQVPLRVGPDRAAQQSESEKARRRILEHELVAETKLLDDAKRLSPANAEGKLAPEIQASTLGKVERHTRNIAALRRELDGQVSLTPLAPIKLKANSRALPAVPVPAQVPYWDVYNRAKVRKEQQEKVRAMPAVNFH